MKFLVTFRPNWWIIGAIFEEICIYVEENEGFGQPLIPFILLIGELQMGPYMVTYWCVSECCSLIGSHRLYIYRNATAQQVRPNYWRENRPLIIGRSRGGVRDARPPPGRPNSFDFMQFSGKFGVFTPPWRVHAPPPSGKSWIRHC